MLIIMINAPLSRGFFLNYQYFHLIVCLFLWGEFGLGIKNIHFLKVAFKINGKVGCIFIN